MKRSHALRSIVYLIGACLVAAAVALAQDPAAAKQEKENDKRIARMTLPAAVQKTIRTHSKGAAILDIARELANWKTVYEVALSVEGRTRDLTIATDGSILRTKEEIALALLPEAARATIETNLGAGKLLIVEAVMQSDTLAFYEVQVKVGKKPTDIRELKVTRAGELLPEEPADE
jgi:hypothetical protein